MSGLDPIHIETVANELAEIELSNFAIRLGLSGALAREIEPPLLTRAASLIDDLSWTTDERSSRVAVLMMSILWEYSDPETRQSLRQRFIVALSRLGLSPTSSMIDSGFYNDQGYEAFDSYRAQIATLAMQLRYSETISGVEFKLTRFQKRLVDTIATNRLVGVSAPTSAGKSFAIYLAIARYLLSSPERKAFYIVPTISLMNQVSSDLRRLFHGLGTHRIRVGNGADQGALANVSVVTQERALSLLQQDIAEVGLLVVDEVQNLERVADDDELRSKILFDVLTDLSHSNHLEKAILSGPRLDNVGALATQIFGHSAVEVAALDSPVASITYSISRDPNGAYLRQHREYLSPATTKIKIHDESIVKGQGQSLYGDDFMEFLVSLLGSLGPESQNIVFSPTADQSARTANKLRSSLGIRTSTTEQELLAQYLSESVHPRYSLTDLVRSGFAYHNGKVPPHARYAVEEAYKEGTIQTLACTTTLMQGVNLPANVVLIRNPRLYVRSRADRSAAELSPYEFANLRGRAGRLMKDLVGRTVVLDESSFSEHRSAQDDLFSDTTKALSPGYGGIFKSHRDEVLAELARPGSLTTGGGKFIAAHVRQTALRHGVNGLERLEASGITLTRSQYGRAMSVADSIDIDRETCLRNRYWDPFDLQMIKDTFEAAAIDDLPNSVWERGFTKTLLDWIRFHATVAPYYFGRYFRADASERMMIAVAKSAETWARENPLRKIVDDRHFSTEEAGLVDSQISLIYKFVVYGLPSLLKPLAEIRGNGSSSLAAIESGTYNPVSRHLVQLGMYRETAVYIKRKLLPDIGANAIEIDGEVRDRVRLGLNALHPWVQRQCVEIFG